MTQIVFIDSRIAGYQTLIDGLEQGSEWFLIDASEDGVAQMAQALSNRSGLNAIHILSHGSTATLLLGSTVLDSVNLHEFQSQLQAIGSSLTATGDILLYGCNVGSGDAGRRFITQIAQLSGADVAGSEDVTGAAVLGGDWQLETTKGSIEVNEEFYLATDRMHTLSLNTTQIQPSFRGEAPGEICNDAAFAALRADGSVVTWGNSENGGDSSSVPSLLDGTIDVVEIFSASGAFSALRADGSVVTWGHRQLGGDSSSVSGLLDGTMVVVDIFSSICAFSALRADGSVVTWGDSGWGGDSSSVTNQLNGAIDVVMIFSNGYTYGAFAALREDGSVVTWGNYFYGGDSSSVASQINGTIDVIDISSTDYEFAALRADGSVVTWGYGNSGTVPSLLDGTVDVVEITSSRPSFVSALLTASGSVVGGCG